MISNPCKWFVTGGSYDDQVEFVHEGGKTLYHFSPGVEIDEKTFKSWVPINLIFFANNKKHAKEIIERMLNVRIKARKEYEKARGKDYMTGESTLRLPELLLSKKDKWIITEAPTNQFYQVGWASNSTIL